MRNLNWKCLKSQYVLQDNLLNLRADTCQMPDGRIISPCYVHEFSSWVNVVALTRRQDIVLVRQYRHGIQKTILELPGGTMQPNDDSPLAAIKRELLEETGFSSNKIIKTGSVFANPAIQNNIVHCFIAHDVEKVSDVSLDEHEDLDVITMPLNAFVTMERKNDTSQAFDIASLLYAFVHLGRL